MRKERADKIRGVAMEFYLGLDPRQRAKRTFKNVYRTFKKWHNTEGSLYERKDDRGSGIRSVGGTSKSSQEAEKKV